MGEEDGGKRSMNDMLEASNPGFADLVRNDYEKWMAGGIGRPAYDQSIYGYPDALDAVTTIMLQQSFASFTQIDKMLCYFTDVYDQGIGFAKLSLGSQADPRVDETVYQKLRDKLVDFALSHGVELQNPDEYTGFTSICRLLMDQHEPTFIQKTIWRIRYDYEYLIGFLPADIKPLEAVQYLKKQLGVYRNNIGKAKNIPYVADN